MIYDVPTESDPIRQGDIFYPLPFVIMENLDEINYISHDEEFKKETWIELSKTDTSIIVPIKPVYGIIASQDCDASRVPYVTFFLIDGFKTTGITLPNPDNLKSWVSIITQKSRLNASWFYLPEERNIGFNNRMVVNFEEIFMVERDYLTKNMSLRIARLNDVAYQHYREKISEYYRRYPYDEWYPLNKNEFNHYKKEKKDTQVQPFNWQK